MKPRTPLLHILALRKHPTGPNRLAFPCIVAGVMIASAATTAAATWRGTTSTDWNVGSNWDTNAVPNNVVAQVNIATPVATISSNLLATPSFIVIANGSTATGRLDHVAGTASTAASQDLQIGRGGGKGTYNLANTAGTGGTLTGFGQGSGSMTVQRHLYVGGFSSGSTASTGNLNVHTTGNLTIGGQLLVGNSLSTGTVKLDSGTLTVNDSMEIGNGASCTGNFSMAGGSLTKANNANTYLTIGGGASGGGTGNFNLLGGTLTSNAILRVANAAGSKGTLTISGGSAALNSDLQVGSMTGSNGSLVVSGGTITQSGWVVIGRKGEAATDSGIGGTGSVTMTGGTWNKSGESNFIVGAHGPGAMTMSGGLIEVTAGNAADRGITWVGEQNNCTGSLTISGSAEFRSNRFTMGVQAGASGTLRLDGGTVRTRQITGGGGTATAIFNGSRIVATGPSNAFLEALDTATIEAGGLVVDTAGFNLATTQALFGSGGVVKSGSGTLTLGGANEFSGANQVLAGRLVLSSESYNTGGITVAEGASLGVKQSSDVSLTVPDASFASGSSLDIDIGGSAGNPSVGALKVTGALTLNGPVRINITDPTPDLGVFPVVEYTQPRAGTGSFVIGTLPNGVNATLVDDGAGLVTLVINRIKLPQWAGGINGTWDTTTLNWFDSYNVANTNYDDGSPLLFDDTATGPTAITLDAVVAPSELLFDHSILAYSITGTGGITGSTGLVKTGTAPLTLGTANTYTGATRLLGGTITLNQIANSGSPSSIGAASADPANLVLGGATVVYTGPAATTDRGLTIAGTGTVLDHATDLTIGGPIVSTDGNLVKKGTGKLILTHNGPNVIGTVNQGLRVQGGVVELRGAGAQTHSVAGELWLADQPDVPADLVLDTTTLNTTSWLAIGRGNGDNGVTRLTATASTLRTANFSTGYNNGLANNASEAFVTLHNTAWTNDGVTYLAESPGSTAEMALTGNSRYSVNNNLLLARDGSTQASLTLSDTGTVVKTGGYTSIGTNGTGVMTVRDNASFTSLTGDFNVSDVGQSVGTLNLRDSGLVQVTNVYIGKGSSTNGTLNQSGGTFTSATTISIGRYTASNGTANLSGGTLTSTGALIVGETGTGTLNVSGNAVATSGGEALYLGYSGGSGVLNLNGGTVVAKQITEGSIGGSALYFNGGILKAAAGAATTFVSGLDRAELLSGGAIIDTNGQNLAITQALVGSGGMTKAGAGTLNLSGANTWTGSTRVTAGTLVLNAAFLGDNSTVTIAAGATLRLSHALTDQVASLSIAGTTLPAGTYDATTHPGAISGTGRLLVTGAPASAYDTWIDGYPTIAAADRDPGDDPDRDGASNAVEFALGGAPDQSGSRPRIHAIVADSDADTDTLPELLLTVAVRGDTPAFTGSPAPAATSEGFTCRIEGGQDLNALTGSVVPVAPVTIGLPAAPTGYGYRSFSLTGSNGTPSKGFLRVRVESTR
jgi:autotransporter-associated beta strand protein/T5SS/PEP-CTERM-associated repeat protein